MAKKITWNMIFADFKQRHPNLRKEVSYWCPRDYLIIELWLKDGRRMLYDYWNHKAEFIQKENDNA